PCHCNSNPETTAFFTRLCWKSAPGTAAERGQRLRSPAPRPLPLFPSMATYTTTDPATGADLGTYTLLDADGIEAALARAADAFARHREPSFGDRAAKLRRLADLNERDERRHAEQMTREMGKPI